ncbi:MAG: hypothetical protein ACPGSC_11125 [Granulosicoccaceae bacterium]
MQLSILTAHDALENLTSSWLGLQNRCTYSDNSNHFLRFADALTQDANKALQVVCLHDGRPHEELHGLFVTEQHRGWIASKRFHANWIAEPGLDSTPLIAEEQLYSAINTLLRCCHAELNCRKLVLRHLLPQHSFAHALLAVCEQLKLATQVSSERKGHMCEIGIPLQRKSKLTLPTEQPWQDTLRSLP